MISKELYREQCALVKSIIELATEKNVPIEQCIVDCMVQQKATPEEDPRFIYSVVIGNLRSNQINIEPLS